MSVIIYKNTSESIIDIARTNRRFDWACVISNTGRLKTLNQMIDLFLYNESKRDRTKGSGNKHHKNYRG